MADVKVAILEKDGVEFGLPTEYVLGFGDIGSADYIDFNTDYVGAIQEGRLQWNSEDGTLDIGMPGGDVTVQIGQELILRAKNSELVTIENGQVVYIDGADGSNPTISLANAASSSGDFVIGVATEDIASSQQGYVTTNGLVRGIDTSFGNVGEWAYLSTTDGDLTTTSPVRPNSSVRVGVIVRAHATEGVLLVAIKDNTTRSCTSIVSKTANYSATFNDDLILCDASSSGFTVTLPDATTFIGCVEVKKVDSTKNKITIATTSTQEIDGEDSIIITKKNTSLKMLSDKSNWWLV